MAAISPALLRHLPAADARAADGELLRRYAETRDEAAFAELVRRTGPLVLRACRNVLPDRAGADDAFQATFLLLARNAARLTDRPSVAGWLHTVAVRSAGKLRRAEVRRRRREGPRRPAPRAHGPADDALWAEVRERIDAELARLPEKYRLPLLLCYAQGLGYDEAARRIGCTLGALRGRLERGREVLRRRLGPWAAPAVLVTAGAAPSAVSAGLLDATLGAVRSAPATAARAAAAWARWAVLTALVAATVTGIGLAALRGPADPKVAPPPLPAVPPAESADAAGDPLPPGALARMGSDRLHHGSNIHRLTVSNDGKWVISSGSHTGYRVWDLETGKEQVPAGMPANARFTRVHGPTSGAVQWEAAVAPAGPRVVAVVPDRERPVTRILDVVTGAEVARVSVSLRHLLTHPFASSDDNLALSADGKWMLWITSTFENQRSKHVLCITDLTAKEPTPDMFADVSDRTPYRFRFSADGTSVVMNFPDAYEVWDRETQAPKLKVPVVPNGTGVGHAVLSPDGKTLAVAQPRAATFQLWDVAAKKELPALADPLTVWSVNVRAFSPDGRQVVASQPDGPLRVWDVATGKKVRDYGGAAHGAWAAAFTPDGKRIAVAQFDDVNVLDLATGKSIHDFGGHAQSVWRLGFAAEGRLVSVAPSGLVWEPRTGRKLGAFPGHPAGTYGTAVSPDGKWIASCGADEKVRLRDAGTLEEVHVIETKGVIGHDVAFTPNGTELAVGSDKPGVRVFDTATGRQRRVIAAGEIANRLQFTPDGKRVVLHKWKDQNNKVRVWDWVADKEQLSFKAGTAGVQATTISPDGRLLAAGGWDGFARVFDLETGKSVREFDTNLPGAHMRDPRDTNRVYAVAFSPDGRALATGDANGAVRMWELATGSERFRLDGHRGSVLAVAFSPSGALLVSGSGDRSAVTWDATGARLPTDPKHRPKDSADAWARLADRDAAAGFAALRYCAARPAEAVPLFAKNIPPIAAAAPEAVKGLIEGLGGTDFATREAAEKKLAALASGAADQLRAALAVTESAEVRQRLGKILVPHSGLAQTGDRLRVARAVEATERAGTAEARKLLRAWADGARGAELTEAARSALARLGDASPSR